MQWGDQAFTPARRQVRALLYYLAATLEPLSRDRLAFLFWADLPDSAARNNLKRLLSTVRSALPERSILTASRDIVGLDRSRIWCDVEEFQRLAAGSDPGSWVEAVGLYHGPFLASFSLLNSPEYQTWHYQLQAQAELAYLDTLSRLVDSRRAAGDLDHAIDYAQRFLAVDELAEDIHRRLIELYGETGDRGAAARQFEACTLALERELGVRPLPETRAAYETAISARPTSPRPPHAWTVLPSLNLPLIGREDAWQALTTAYHRLKSGGVILISGEPGVGKSRLMQEFAAACQSTVLTGNNPSSGHHVPYHAVSEALRQALSVPQRWQTIRPIWLAEASRLLPEMAETFPHLPASVSVEPDQAQARLFEALTRCFIGLAQSGPLMLCLDDLHWADPATLGWLAALPRRLAGSNVCVVGTYRHARAEALVDLMRAYARHGLLGEAPLSRLSVDAVAQVLNQLPQRPPDPALLARRIHHATGGNTFFVLETLRALLEDGRLADPPDQLPLAQSVQATIERRLTSLSELGRQLLETAAVLAPELESRLLHQVAGRTEMETARGLDELDDRHLLAGSTQHRFNHDLVRQVAYAGISPWRQRILHRRAAQALETTDTRAGEPVWAEVAVHYDRAGDRIDAIRCYELAALTAQRLYAHQEAIDFLEQALAIDGDGPAEVRARLQELLGDSLMARGQHEGAARAYRSALAAVAAEQHLARAVLQRKVADTFRARLMTGEAEAAALQASATLGKPAADWPLEWLHAWLDNQLALMSVYYFRGDFDMLTQLIAAIEPVVMEVGTSGQRVNFAYGLAELAVRREHFTLSQDTVERFKTCQAAAQEAGGLAQIAWSQFGVGFGLLWSGDTEGAEHALLTALRQSEEAGTSYYEVVILVYLACCYRFQNDAEAARGVIYRGLATASEVDMPIYEGAVRANLAWLAWRDGKVDTALAEAKRAVDIWGDYPYPFRWLAHWVLLAVHTERGDLVEAVEQAQAILHPTQRRQPGALPAALEEAMRALEAGNTETTQAALRRAIAMARRENYL